jgi:hypothetical protein
MVSAVVVVVTAVVAALVTASGPGFFRGIEYASVFQRAGIVDPDFIAVFCLCH